MDYSITWNYIIEQMEKKFKLSPNSQEKRSMGEIEHYINLIWTDYFNELLEKDPEFIELKN